jgi:hypothetical protein
VAPFFEIAAVPFDVDEGVVDLNSKAGLDNFIAAAMQPVFGIANLGSVVQGDRLLANIALAANPFGDDPLGSVGPMPAPRSFDRQKSGIGERMEGIATLDAVSKQGASIGSHSRLDGNGRRRRRLVSAHKVFVHCKAPPAD